MLNLKRTALSVLAMGSLILPISLRAEEMTPTIKNNTRTSEGASMNAHDTPEPSTTRTPHKQRKHNKGASGKDLSNTNTGSGDNIDKSYTSPVKNATPPAAEKPAKTRGY